MGSCKRCLANSNLTITEQLLCLSEVIKLQSMENALEEMGERGKNGRLIKKYITKKLTMGQQ